MEQHELILYVNNMLTLGYIQEELRRAHSILCPKLLIYYYSQINIFFLLVCAKHYLTYFVFNANWYSAQVS